jgi:purine nucleoside permease
MHLKAEEELFAFVRNTAESQAQNPPASTFCERAKFTAYYNKLNLRNKIPEPFKTLTIS